MCHKVALKLSLKYLFWKLQSTVEQQMSPQKKGNSAVTDKCDPRDSEQPSKTSENVAENERNEGIAGGELGVAESTTEEVQCDPQMGVGTLESLEAREDFKRQLEVLMGATKVYLPSGKCY